jgi:hypothetical protein
MPSLRVALLVAAAFTSVSLGAGVVGVVPTVDPPPKVAFAPVRLYPLPARALTQCRLARAVQLCPQRLPRVWIAYRGDTPPALRAERFATGRNGNAIEAGISFTHGVPWEPTSGPDWRQPHGGIDRAAFSTSTSGTRCAASRHFPTRLDPRQSAAAGRPSYRRRSWARLWGGAAGVYFCNHVRFRWKQGGSWFVATLHSFGNRETTALLGRLIRKLRPIGSLTRS